jgi:hypothetical protein
MNIQYRVIAHQRISGRFRNPSRRDGHSSAGPVPSRITRKSGCVVRSSEGRLDEQPCSGPLLLLRARVMRLPRRSCSTLAVCATALVAAWPDCRCITRARWAAPIEDARTPGGSPSCSRIAVRCSPTSPVRRVIRTRRRIPRALHITAAANAARASLRADS